MKPILFTLFLSISAYIGMAHAQGNFQAGVCGKTQPRFCVSETIRLGNSSYTISGVNADGTYKISGSSSSYDAVDLAKTSGCGRTKPSFCHGEVIRLGNSSYQISGIRSDGTYLIAGSTSTYEADDLAKTSGRGNTKPSFCIGETVRLGNSNYKISGYLPVSKMYKIAGSTSDYSAADLGKISNVECPGSANGSGVLDFTVSLSFETQDMTEAYGSLSKVTTKERATFLKSLGESIKKSNSGDVNLFAGFLFSKLVRLSTAQVVRDHFEPEVAKFISDLNKSNWKSVMQVPANDQTVSFAIQVIAAGVRVRNSQAQVSPETELKLKTLAAAAAKDGLFAKAIALREFLSENMVLITDLVADPRHGALGSIVADTAEWVHNGFKDKK